MSLLKEYYEEIKVINIIECDEGFATYYFINEGCYIQDIFVKKEHRRSGLATKLLDQITDIAKEKNCTTLFGSCVPSAHNSTESLSAAFSYGFKLHSSKENFVLYAKEIKG